MIMEEDLIQFETAILAEEKGCELNLYDDNWTYTDEFDELYVCNYKPDKIGATRVVLCTQSLLQKWLREKHKINVIPDYDVNKKQYFYWIIKGNSTRKLEPSYYETHEEALEEGLKQALKLIN